MIKVLAAKDYSVEIVQRAYKQVELETGLVPNSDENSVPTTSVLVQ